MEKNEYRMVENLSRGSRQQKSCIEMLEEMMRRHMVKIRSDPSFIPGPKIL